MRHHERSGSGDGSPLRQEVRKPAGYQGLWVQPDPVGDPWRSCIPSPSGAAARVLLDAVFTHSPL